MCKKNKADSEQLSNSTTKPDENSSKDSEGEKEAEKIEHEGA